MQRPLWRILLDVQQSESTPLSEAECAALLEFLVEEVMVGADPEALKPLIVRCLTQMPSSKSGSVQSSRRVEERGSRERC